MREYCSDVMFMLILSSVIVAFIVTVSVKADRRGAAYSAHPTGLDAPAGVSSKQFAAPADLPIHHP